MAPKLNFQQIKVKFDALPTKYPVIVKFFQPLNKKYRFLTISTSVIIGIVLYVLVNIGLAEVVRQNSYDIHMLASEMIIELGPNLTYESKTHAEMIRRYAEHLEQRQFAGILRVLYPKYSPMNSLTSVLSGLEKAVKGKEEEAKKAIWEAGLASDELYERGKMFPESPYKWFKSEGPEDLLLTDLNMALTESSKLVNKLEKEQTVEAAIASCRSNRKTILLLFLARLSYDNEEKIKSFQKEVEQARDCTKLLAKENVKDKEKQEWIYEIARSEDRRVKILEAMLVNDMDKVCQLLREAIERAFENERVGFND